VDKETEGSPKLDELATLFIVSQAEVVDSLGDDAHSGGEVEGLKVAVAKAEGEKCERCWNYATTVGANSEHPAICASCSDALS